MARRTQKQILIDRIKNIISQDGAFSTEDVEAESSPVYTFNSNKQLSLIERFHKDHVDIDTYFNEEIVANTSVKYEDLDVKTLNEILVLAFNWSVKVYKEDIRN